MEIDPSRWLVSLAGFSYDWILTRDWKKILLGSLPLVFLVTVAALVWYGQRLDKGDLAQWYLELGEAEIADWEKSWTSGDKLKMKTLNSATEPDGSPEEETAADTNANVTLDGDAVPAPSKLSSYGEMLFRRVQLLQPSNRSQYVVGATFFQRGAFDNAERMLSKIAPDDQPGYAPAHALLGMLNLTKFEQTKDRQLLPIVLHHAKQAARWENAPESVLLIGSNLLWGTGKRDDALQLMQVAAERNPRLYSELYKRARILDNARVADLAFEKGTQFLTQRLEEDPADAESRVLLAEFYSAQDGGLDRAEQLLREGEEIERSDILNRGLSEVYRVRFLKSIQVKDGNVSAQINLLDAAMRLDPTNPQVPEEVAKLARFNAEANEDLIDSLNKFLVAGAATVATHAWLAEAHLVNEDYVRAKTHLEQVVRKMPQATKYMNNLAYVYAVQFDRLDEARELIERTVAYAAAKNEPRADYYDTAAMIYAKLDRPEDAIAAYETAIELDSRRPEFHERVAEQYRKIGNEGLAKSHEDFAVALQKALLNEQASPATAEPTPSPTPPQTPETDSGSETTSESPGEETADAAQT